MEVKISIDAMGGDFGPEVTMEALKQVLASQLDVRASVFGDSAIIQPLIDSSFLCPYLMVFQLYKSLKII